MNFSEYQQAAARTMANVSDDRDEKGLAVYALGLAGETGEVVELIKKHVGHGHDLDEAKLSKELGDVLWYLSAVATYLEISLDDVAELNIQKLKKRYPEGFSSEASKNRESEP